MGAVADLQLLSSWPLAILAVDGIAEAAMIIPLNRIQARKDLPRLTKWRPEKSACTPFAQPASHAGE